VNRAENEFNQAHAYIYIHQIGVDEDARRKGAGTALISFMRDRARMLGLSAMQVDHWAFNASARAFFEACGFTAAYSTEIETVAGAETKSRNWQS
jgi:GNAT superfamily N-acetyltransferase